MGSHMNQKQTIQSVFSITELSRDLDITTRSIRHYEDIGLITPKRQGQTRRLAEIRVSDEGQEGLSAFLEKRHPNWQGKKLK